MARRADAAEPAVLLVDKPAGLTSHDVVSRVRRLAGTRRVGHAGTLDPMATGLLVLGIGRATRLLTHLVGLDKEYTATIRLGVSTDSDDATGQVTGGADAGAVAPDALAAAMAGLTGSIEQVPNTVSAIKVDGRRSYERARAGDEVALKARPVTVHAFELLAERPGTAEGRAVLDLDVHTHVSSGTYVRALARDLGAALGVGGHLTALRRTRVGPFDVAAAHPLDALLEAGELTLDGRDARLTPGQVAARVFPARTVDAEQAALLVNGRRIEGTGSAGTVAALDGQGTLVALLEDRAGAAQPVLVLGLAQ